MLPVALNERHLKTLSVFGDVNQLVGEAVEDYLIRKIDERIKSARAKLQEYEAKYGVPYSTFSEKMVLDEAYSIQINKMNPLWEQDSHQWEYWQEEAQEWTEKRNGILSKS